MAARLVWWLEAKEAINQRQVGIRRGRETVDQCLRISQRISDRFQRKPPDRTVMVLFDYARAFDTVWRGAVMEKMMDKGIPRSTIEWVQAWLLNRRAVVRIGTTTSRERVFKWGLSQGAVLSPTLFIIFIDEFGEGTEVSAFADDLAIASSHPDKDEAQRRIQNETDKVARWSRKWQLSLNTEKCEACLFTTATGEAQWKPEG